MLNTILSSYTIYSADLGTRLAPSHEKTVHTWASLLENRSSGFHTRSHTNQAVQPQKMASALKFRI